MLIICQSWSKSIFFLKKNKEPNLFHMYMQVFIFFKGSETSLSENCEKLVIPQKYDLGVLQDTKIQTFLEM